jgi:hypothetical protein
MGDKSTSSRIRWIGSAGRYEGSLPDGRRFLILNIGWGSWPWEVTSPGGQMKPFVSQTLREAKNGCEEEI